MSGMGRGAIGVDERSSRSQRPVAAFLKPELTPGERTVAQVEGWILGAPGLMRSDSNRVEISRLIADAPLFSKG